MARPRLKIDPTDTTMLGMAVSNTAYGKLQEAAHELNIGQKHILNVILENLDIEALRAPVAEYLSRHRNKPALNPHQVREYLATLSPEDRKKFLAE